MLHGGEGDDTLRGLGGADTLDGGAGVNLLDCGGSVDTLIAGPQDSLIACDPVPATPPGRPRQSAARSRKAGRPTDGAPARHDAAARPRRQGRAARERVAAGKLTLALKRGRVTYLRRSVTVARRLHAASKLSASTRTLRQHAKITLTVTLDTVRATVVVKRG